MTQLNELSSNGSSERDQSTRNKIHISTGAPMLHAFESKINLKLAMNKEFVLFNTITNKGGEANGIFILLPWNELLEEYIKITAIKVVSTKDKEKALIAKPLLLKKNEKTYLSAKFPEIKPSGYPYTDENFVKTEKNKIRFHKALAKSTLWTSVKGIALKKGDIEIIVKTIPYNNEKKLSQPVTYNLSIR